ADSPDRHRPGDPPEHRGRPATGLLRRLAGEVLPQQCAAPVRPHRLNRHPNEKGQLRAGLFSLAAPSAYCLHPTRSSPEIFTVSEAVMWISVTTHSSPSWSTMRRSHLPEDTSVRVSESPVSRISSPR